MKRDSRDHENPDQRSRILDEAETLFSTKGFNSVTLRDIAEPLGLRHSALYYHFPGGKEALFAEVMERNIRRHGAGLSAKMDASDGSLRGKLFGASEWLISQPPLDLLRMSQTDLKALAPDQARMIMDLVYTLILRKLQDAFESAATKAETGPCDAGLLAGGVLGLVESLHAAPVSVVGRKKEDMARDLIDVLLKGIEYTGIKEDEHVRSRT